MVKNKKDSFTAFFSHQKEISLVFLGVGLVLFLLNISGLLAYLPAKYSYSAFNISVFSSMLVIIYSVYILESLKVEK